MSDSDTARDSAEECDGVDDDGDGAVDEGFPDTDADGRADCINASCPEGVTEAAGAVPINPECGEVATPVADPWAVRLRGVFGAPAEDPTSTGAFFTPIVARLDDDDGTPEILSADTNFRVWAIEPDGSTSWSSDDTSASALHGRARG